MFRLDEPIVNKKIKLINSTIINNHVVPAGTIFTVRWNNFKGCYLEDENGIDIYDYFCIANFESIRNE